LTWLLLVNPRDEEVRAAIQRLANDPVPSVRFLIGTELFRLRQGNADLLFEILSRRISDESSATVLDGVCITLHNTLDLPQCREFVKKLYERVEGESTSFEYHADVIAMLVDMAVAATETWASIIVTEWIAKPAKMVRFVVEASNRLVQYITPTMQRHLASSALRLEAELIRSLLRDLESLHGLPQEAVTEEHRKTAEKLYRALDHAVANFYFSFDFEGTGQNRGELVPTDKQRRVFFSDLRPLIETIIEFGTHEGGWLLAPTAHHLMELLRGAVEYNPREVLRLAAELAVGSTKGRYPFDSLAIKEVVELVEHLLADHRADIRDAASLKNLLQLLDTFASAGWPEALQLVWRLDEVYR